jgi:predicted ATPase
VLTESIDVAHAQSARSRELRSATSLARLLAPRDRMRARAVLEPVLAWFTEGHGTKDLIEARELLESLGR